MIQGHHHNSFADLFFIYEPHISKATHSVKPIDEMSAQTRPWSVQRSRRSRPVEWGWRGGEAIALFSVDVDHIFVKFKVEMEYLSCLHWRICRRSPIHDWWSRQGRWRCFASRPTDQTRTRGLDEQLRFPFGCVEMMILAFWTLNLFTKHQIE